MEIQNSADLPTFHLDSAFAMVDDLFGVKINKARFDEWARIAYRKIGPNLKTGKLFVTVKSGGEVTLPCRVLAVEAVSMNPGTYNQWDVAILEGNIKTYGSPDNFKVDYSPGSSNVPGEYVDFELIDRNTIKVNPNLKDCQLYILLKYIVTNSDGELLFTEKQIEAIAYYVAYLYTLRNTFAGKGVGLGVSDAKTLAGQAIAQARVPEYVSDNQWDEMLNMKVSANRKTFNTDYKI